MARRTRRVALFAAVLATALPAVLSAADQPPRNLKYVNGHWTAWDPPASFPEGTQVHVVQPGDTFWDLAAANLGNPYLWPQIWEKNQYVLDAHWIYPGDPLDLGLAVAPAQTGDLGGEVDETVDVAGTGPGGAVDPGAAGLGGDASGGDSGQGAGAGAATASSRLETAPAGGSRSVPVPLGSEDDIYCNGYIGDVDEAFSYKVIGSEYEVLSPTLLNVNVSGRVEGLYGTVDTVKVELTTGDLVYVDGGRAAGLAPGMIFTAIQPGPEISHPVRREVFGRQFTYRGRVRILSVEEETAIAEVVQSCLGLRVGNVLKPYVPEPVPLARRTPMRPSNDPTTEEALADAPVILASPARLVTLGQDHVVYLDKGEEDDVLPGDVFTIYRTNKSPKPPVVVGELAVLSVQPHSAVARILESRYPVYAGDRLERK